MFQVVNLQAQLASLKEQAAQSFPNVSGSSNTKPNDDHRTSSYGKIPSHSPQDFQSWFQSQNSSMMPQFDNLNISANIGSYCDQNEIMNMNSSGNYEMNSVHLREENVSYSKYSMDSLHDMQTSNNQWSYRDDIDDLQSVAFGYYQQ